MFKKRNIEKKTVDVGEDIESIKIEEKVQQEEHAALPKSIHSKKINKFSNKQQKQTHSHPAAEKTPVVRYGLIDKSQVNSKYHANQDGDEEKKPKETNSLVNLFVKKKMQEMNNQAKEGYKEKEKKNAETQIMQMQKKYLQASEQRLAEYNIEEIQRKLEKTATAAIKSQMENRVSYLKNLLQNQYQKMEYASKKQLKTMKQAKERLEQEFQSKYKDEGRRGYVDKMKYSAMLGK